MTQRCMYATQDECRYGGSSGAAADTVVLSEGLILSEGLVLSEGLTVPEEGLVIYPASSCARQPQTCATY